MRAFYHMTVLLAVGVSLLACGAGDEGSSLPKEKTDFLPYQVVVLDEKQEYTVEINTVDVKNPAKHLKVDFNDNGNIAVFDVAFQSGLYEASSFSISHYHATHILYSNSGRLKALPIYQVFNARPFTISNETEMYNVCTEDIRRANDYFDQDNSRLVYKIMDVGVENCGYKAGSLRMVSLSTKESESPKVLPSSINYIVEPIHDMKTGALTGWLTVNNSVLTRYDVEFNNPQIVKLNGAAITVSNHARLLVRTREHHFILIVDTHLYHYDPSSAANEISAGHAGYIPHEGTRVEVNQYVSDGEYFYFTVDTYVNEKDIVYSSDLYRLRITGGSVAEKLLSEAKGIGYLTLTNGTLVFSANGIEWEGLDYPVFTEVRRMNKQDLKVATLALPSYTIAIYALRSENDRLYATVSRQGPADTTYYQSLLIFQDGGADSDFQKFDHYQFVGTTYHHVLYPYRDSFNVDYLLYFDHNPVTSARELFSVAASTGEHKAHMGSLPNNVDYRSINFSFTARGHPVGLFHIPIQGTYKYDLYFYDAERENSLHKIEADELYGNRAIYHKLGGASKIDIRPIETKEGF